MCTVQFTIYAQYKYTRHPKKSSNSTLVAEPKCLRHMVRCVSLHYDDIIVCSHFTVWHWTVRAAGPGQGYYTPAPGSAQAGQLSPSRLVLTDHQPTESPSCDHPPATSHPIQSRADGADSVHSKQVVCLLASTNHGPGAQLSANQRAG